MYPPIVFMLGSLVLYAVILPMVFFVLWTPSSWEEIELIMLGVLMMLCSSIGLYGASRAAVRPLYVRKIIAIHCIAISTGAILVVLASIRIAV